MVARSEREHLPKTHHTIYQGDARFLSQVIADSSIHLIVTSPPYWSLKRYPPAEGQLGNIPELQSFLPELNRVWKSCFQALVPGGRMCVVVGDVCLSRKKHGRHHVIPLHSYIIQQCIEIGFDNLAPIIWYKIANCQTEMTRSTYFLGKPFEPNAIIKNDIEFILIFRKPGEYRHPTQEQRLRSKMPKADFFEYFQQVWDIRGASTRKHPAPFPDEIATRLTRMFSFAGDIVLDPFVGTGTTSVAASKLGRSSIGFELDRSYVELCRSRFLNLDLYSPASFEIKRLDHS